MTLVMSILLPPPAPTRNSAPGGAHFLGHSVDLGLGRFVGDDRSDLESPFPEDGRGPPAGDLGGLRARHHSAAVRESELPAGGRQLVEDPVSDQYDPGEDHPLRLAEHRFIPRDHGARGRFRGLP